MISEPTLQIGTPVIALLPGKSRMCGQIADVYASTKDGVEYLVCTDGYLAVQKAEGGYAFAFSDEYRGKFFCGYDRHFIANPGGAQ